MKGLVGSLWYWFNNHFGVRRYFMLNGSCYIQEGSNPPEELFAHLKKRHPEEYEETKQRLGKVVKR